MGANVKPKKEKLDTSAFIFEIDIKLLEEKLAECYLELEDLCEYQQPDSEQRKRINELKYWLMIWERDLPEAKKRNLTTVPLSAIEGRVLGTYDKKSKSSSAKKLRDKLKEFKK